MMSMLVTRSDVEHLEALLSKTDAARRSVASVNNQLARELEEAHDLHRAETHSLRMSRDALLEEVYLIRQRLEDALRERDELIADIEPLEFEISALRHRATNDAAKGVEDVRVERATMFRSYFGVADTTDAVVGGSTPGGGGVGDAREQQLLSVIEQSAAVFMSLDQEIRESQAELQQLKSEKQHWLTSEYELHAAIARLENEREQYIARELVRSSTVIVASHALSTEEWRERKLLEAQADATLHNLAYQRCRNDAAVIAKQLNAKLNAVASDRNREMRQLEGEMKLENERVCVSLNAAHQKEIQDAEAKLEALRLARQKVELQNTMLKSNCDEWRAHSEKKDADHERSLARLVAEAQSQLGARDELLRTRDAEIASLRGDRTTLEASLSDARRKLDDAQRALDGVHQREQQRLASLRPSYAQTDDVEGPEAMKQRLMREIDAEDEVQIARRVTAHPLFVKLQSLTSALQSDLAEHEGQLATSKQHLSEARTSLADTQQRLTMAERKYEDDKALLVCERDAAAQRCEVLQRQRDIAQREVANAQLSIESLQADHGKTLREVQDAVQGRCEAERKWRDASATLDALTSQLGLEMHQGADKDLALTEATSLLDGLRHQVCTLQQTVLCRDESVARCTLTHAVEVIQLRLKSIGDALATDATGEDGA